MTDKELLELAAKAADISLVAWTKFFDEWKFACNPCGEPWNPLIDDGDALRLAVKLGFHVSPRSVEVWRDGKEVINIFEDGEDPYAATRRAIVRAAAELGKKTP